MNTILLIGPKSNIQDPSNTGGAVVLFENLLEQMENQDIDFNVIDTNKNNYSNVLFAYICIIIKIILKQVNCYSISLHSSRDYIFIAPLIIIIGKLFNKRTSLRKFGGEAEQTYSEAKGLKKKLLHIIFSKIDTLFFEMKYLVNYFQDINSNTYWFPNVRNRIMEPNLPRNFSKRFVFISHVKREKGIDEILEASLKFDESYTIDIYGPIVDEKYTNGYFNNYNVNYLGALLSDEVLKTLNNYDVLLLPSYKEGYPGVVIEAYSLGIPVITTALQGLQEIVEINRTGVLIEQKNVNELVSAIEYFDKTNYMYISDAAYKKFDEFQADIQTKLFLDNLER